MAVLVGFTILALGLTAIPGIIATLFDRSDEPLHEHFTVTATHVLEHDALPLLASFTAVLIAVAIADTQTPRAGTRTDAPAGSLLLLYGLSALVGATALATAVLCVTAALGDHALAPLLFGPIALAAIVALTASVLVYRRLSHPDVLLRAAHTLHEQATLALERLDATAPTPAPAPQGAAHPWRRLVVVAALMTLTGAAMSSVLFAVGAKIWYSNEALPSSAFGILLGLSAYATATTVVLAVAYLVSLRRLSNKTWFTGLGAVVLGPVVVLTIGFSLDPVLVILGAPAFLTQLLPILTYALPTGPQRGLALLLAPARSAADTARHVAQRRRTLSQEFLDTHTPQPSDPVSRCAGMKTAIALLGRLSGRSKPSAT